MTITSSLMFISCCLFSIRLSRESRFDPSLQAAVLQPPTKSTFEHHAPALFALLTPHLWPVGNRKLNLPVLHQRWKGEKHEMNLSSLPLKDLSYSRSKLQSNLFVKHDQSCTRQDLDVIKLWCLICLNHTEEHLHQLWILCLPKLASTIGVNAGRKWDCPHKKKRTYSVSSGAWRNIVQPHFQESRRPNVLLWKVKFSTAGTVPPEAHSVFVLQQKLQL